MMGFNNQDDEKLKRFKRLRAEKSRRTSENIQKNEKHKRLKGSQKWQDDPARSEKFDWRKYI